MKNLLNVLEGVTKQTSKIFISSQFCDEYVTSKEVTKGGVE